MSSGYYGQPQQQHQAQGQPIYVDQYGRAVNGQGQLVDQNGFPLQQQTPAYAQAPQQQHQHQNAYVGQPAPQQQYNQSFGGGNNNYNQNYNGNHHDGGESGKQRLTGAGAQGERFKDGATYNDVGFAVLFVLFVLGMLILMFANIGRLGAPQGTNASTTGVDPSDMQKLAVSLVVCVVVAGIFAALWLKAMIENTEFLIKLGMWLSIVFAAVLVLVNIVFTNVMGIIFSILVLLIVCYFYWRVRRRVPFAALVLRTVTQVTKMYPQMITISFATVLVSVVWTALFVLAFAVHQDSGLAQFYILFTYYWGAQVIKNTLHVTCSGTYATWYFMSGTDEGVPENPTAKSLKRATTYSFGSICFGSMIIAIIKLLRTIVNSVSDEESILACICLSILRCLDDLVQYFNHWAYVQVAIYGKPFKEAATSTWELFKSSGWEAIINDDLIDNVLAMGAIFGGVVTAAIGVLVAYAQWPDSSVTLNLLFWGISGVVGLIMGYAITRITLESVNSGVTTLFVAYVEQPQVLRQNNPNLAEQMDAQYNVW